ncbi:phosphoribosylanthranilate isomerase [Bradyrhizobium sp. CIAT3101]|uniref:phosphoribosylanthranilate isomerase n=1 Tax=Bradyrhizobium sp. CIAT3101 TaxID=439387 RepID=UPI0024B1836C|nr:phosphoribosylanthranilate isomerase [Bradyrhizobium sp. CIAT3101]WFU82855.1 phosphoribosylanthranilate isomerase [Bradyrhizobium sp. CIAT3101]
MKVKVKVCGLATPEAVDAAVKGGATHIGFAFSRMPSAGYVTLEQAAELVACVPRHVRKVGVFFEQDSIFFMAAIHAARLHILQFNGIDRPSGIVGKAVWGVVPVRTAKDLRAATRWKGIADRILYELKPPDDEASEAGSALRGNWNLLRGIKHPLPWALGGELDPSNVAEAIATTGARMIDVSSSLDNELGVKDPAKISALLNAVRSI